MTYYQAKQCFDENSQLLQQNPMDQPYIWNLSVGLSNLTQALESGQNQIVALLQQILVELQRLRR